jgi:uncharacterized membrane protein YbaN (DUF454 family)
MRKTIEAPGLSKRWLRPVFMVLGALSLAVAAIGLFLPLIPTTGPVLAAAFFFARSSERLHSRLVNHPRFGRFISDFQAGRGIPRRAKVSALVMMSAAFAYSTFWALDHIAARIVVAAIGLWALWYVARLPHSDRSGAEWV